MLWRYQDDWKFKDLLETETLYFSGLEYLDDPLEGEPTESLREMIELVESPSRRVFFQRSQFLDTVGSGDAQQVRLAQSVLARSVRELLAHRSRRRNGVLWKLCKTTRSVAIRTTVGAIMAAVEHDSDVSTWKVHYVNYDSNQDGVDRIHDFPVEHLVSHKSMKYSYEQEFRLVHSNLKERVSRYLCPCPKCRESPSRRGHRVAIDPGELIQEVRIHPDADSSFVREIQALVEARLPGVAVTSAV